MPLLTISNFTQQIITGMKLSFEFLYSFGPTHARKIETEMISVPAGFAAILRVTLLEMHAFQPILWYTPYCVKS